MARKPPAPNKPRECSLCGIQEGELRPNGKSEMVYNCEGGAVCESCLEGGHNGRDATTRSVRAERASMRAQATANICRVFGDHDGVEYHEHQSAELANKAADLLKTDTSPELALGEVVPKRRGRIRNTLIAPDAANLDASAHRLALLDRLGTDCAAMALDAADSIQAGNSLEKMLAHQMAAAHKATFEIFDKAAFQQNVQDKVRMLNLACRLMETYQKGLLTIQKLRTGGEQTIHVQHVHVADGGQAVVGNVKVGSNKK